MNLQCKSGSIPLWMTNTNSILFRRCTQILHIFQIATTVFKYNETSTCRTSVKKLLCPITILPKTFALVVRLILCLLFLSLKPSYGKPTDQRIWQYHPEVTFRTAHPTYLLPFCKQQLLEMKQHSLPLFFFECMPISTPKRADRDAGSWLL